MTPQEVRDRVERNQACMGDSEGAHCMEDELYVDVLKAIASGSPFAGPALALEALAASDLDYDRWYA